MAAESIQKCCAYARVSTLTNQDPSHQLVTIREFARSQGYLLTKEYVDQGISGSRDRRPALDQMIKAAKRGEFHIIIIYALDRLFRNTKHLLTLIDDLKAHDVSIISTSQNIDFTSPLGQATLTILSCVAQLERELIRERIRNALAAKKLTAQVTGNGWRSGRPVKLKEDVQAQIELLAQQGLSTRAISKRLDGAVRKSSIHAFLKRRKAAK